MPFYRKIVWVIGEKGDEGKSFFQWNVRKEFGYSRVITLELGGPARNTYHILGKLISSNTNIFLFNVARGEYLYNEHYKLLESIKDGKSMEAKMIFTRPNVLIVFANREPDMDKLSEDRLIILKISEDLTHLTEITEDSLRRKKKKKIVIESDESEDD